MTSSQFDIVLNMVFTKIPQFFNFSNFHVPRSGKCPKTYYAPFPSNNGEEWKDRIISCTTTGVVVRVLISTHSILLMFLLKSVKFLFIKHTSHHLIQIEQMHCICIKFVFQNFSEQSYKLSREVSIIFEILFSEYGEFYFN